MSSSDDEPMVTIPQRWLDDLARRAMSLGWEVANGHHAADGGEEQRRRLVREAAGDGRAWSDD